MRQLRHVLVLSLAATALVAAGCGDDDDEGGQAQTSTPAASTPQPAQGDTAASLSESGGTVPFQQTGKSLRRRSTLSANAAGGGPSTYCSPTGDYCVGVARRGRTTLLSIASLAFSGSYRLCVVGPPGRGCKSFRLNRRGQMWASTISFAAPARGRYTASWFYGGQKLGRSLSFTA